MLYPSPFDNLTKADRAIKMPSDAQNTLDERFMSLAISEANKSIPSPNAYCVGCVIVRNNSLVSTGYSRELSGNTHAEQVALIKLDFIATDATLYTTMEPCSERLSRNTPCVDNCIRAHVKRVVIGVKEPTNFVRCRGVEKLTAAGIAVDILHGFEEACLLPNRHIDLHV